VFGKDSPLAHIVEFGTAAHRIATKTKRILADAAFGLFFGRVVNHPGSREHPFLRPAADAKSIQALEVIGNVIGEGVEKEALKLGRKR
jgi:hypothetical protein